MTVMMMDEPALAQRRAALLRANDVRFKRADAKRDVTAGKLDLTELLYDVPVWLRTAKVGDVLEWEPGIGRWRASRVLNGLARANARLDTLSLATRLRIVARFRETTPYQRHAA